VAALVTQLNANPAAVTDEDLEQLQIRGYDNYSRIRLPDLLPLSEPTIIELAQATFPDAPASQAVVLRWHLRSLTLACYVRSCRVGCVDVLPVQRTCRPAASAQQVADGEHSGTPRGRLRLNLVRNPLALPKRPTTIGVARSD
jgi:hypothetical protein